MIKLFTGLRNLLAQRSIASPSRSFRPGLEQLEAREVLYSVSGNAWANPALITISFMPDNTPISTSGSSQVGSNLFSTFNAKFGSASAWQNTILKAAQVWAQQTNINFAVVTDNGTPSGDGNYQQGDPGMGDIRIGGYNFGNTSLAMAAMPPSANNYSLAGDIAFNTAEPFNNGSSYDLFTVAMHEFGHALGMEHSSSTATAVMYPSYNGVKKGLSSDDIAGIRNIYSSNGARSNDVYDASGGDGTFASARNLNSSINATSQTALLSNLDITTTSDADYFSVTAPAGTSGKLTVKVQSAGLSLLAPNLTVYAANQTTVLGSASGLNQYGTTLSVTMSNITAGEQFYVKVQGADTTPFGTGRYALAVNFGTGATPSAASPSIKIANGSPLSGSGGLADNPNTVDGLLSGIPLMTGISPDTGASSNDGVTNATRIVLSGQAPAASTVKVYRLSSNGTPTLIGQTTCLLTTWSFDYTGTTLSPGTYQFTATATPLLGLLGILGLTPASNFADAYTVTVDTTAPKAPALSGVGEDTSVPGQQTLWINGTAAANSTVTVYSGTSRLGTTNADTSGNWSYGYTSTSFANGAYQFTATATDLAGNVSALASTFKLALGTGALNLSTPTLVSASILSTDSNGNITTVSTPTFTGKAVAGTLVTVLDGNTVLGTVLADANGNWSFTSPALAAGTHELSVFDTDSQGNAGLLSGLLTFQV